MSKSPSSPQLEAERARLAHRAQLLDPAHADPDLVEEMVRRELGVARPDEVILVNDAAAVAQPASVHRP